MTDAPPAALLRLREGDVVRLCGLDATAHGLELSGRHGVTRPRRDGARLEALVRDDIPCHAWIAARDDPTGDASARGALRWGCDCASTSVLACAHVAALLTAWVRHPADFAATASPEPEHAPVTTEAQAPPARAARLRQPPLLAPPRAARTPVTLRDELGRLPNAELAARARRVLGAEAGTPTDHELATRLAAVLTDSLFVEALIARLDPRIGELLTLILLCGAAVTVADVDALAQRLDQPASALYADLTALERHALVFRVAGQPGSPATGGQRASGQLAGWRIPPEVAAALHVSLPLSPLPTTGASGGAPLVTRAVAGAGAGAHAAHIVRATPRSLCLALALLAYAPRPLGPLASGGAPPLAPQHASRGRGAVVVAGDLPPALLAERARAAGLAPGLARMARRLLLWCRAADPSSQLTDLPRVPAAEMPRALLEGFRLWTAAAEPAELVDLDLSESPVRARVEPAHAAFHPAALAAEIADARAFIVRLLRDARPGPWYDIDAFARLVWQLRPYFLRARQHVHQTPAWWLETTDTGRALRATVAAEWYAGEGAVLRLLLTGPLHWWGVLDLARDGAGSVRAFRVTPWGAYLLGRDAPTPTDDQVKGLIGEWGPAVLATRNGTLAVQPLAAGAGLLDALAIWAQPTTLAQGRLIYLLSADRACAALDSGAHPAPLLAALRAVEGGARAAELIASRLGAIQHAYGATRIEMGVVLVEARDEATLVEALALAPAVRARCRYLGPAVALLPPDALDALRTVLAAHGY